MWSGKVQLDVEIRHGNVGLHWQRNFNQSHSMSVLVSSGYKNMKYLVITLLLLANSLAYACLGSSQPSVHAYNKYSKIFIAEVTGVNLHEYGKRKAASIARGESKKYFADYTLEHEVRLVVTSVIRGTVAKTVILTVEGCGIKIPALKSRGLFFIHRKTNRVIPVYETGDGEYSGWLLRLYYELLFNSEKSAKID